MNINSTRNSYQISEYSSITAVATTALEKEPQVFFSTVNRDILRHLSHFLNPAEQQTLSTVSPDFLIAQANANRSLKEICPPEELIKHLKQHGNKIHSLNVTGLDFSLAYELLTYCPKIEHLTLTSITDDKVEQLLQLGASLKSLSSLHLTGGTISAKGARALAQSENLKSLTSLNLNSNKIGIEGTKALASSKYLCALTSLNLSDNEIGDNGATALAWSKNLKSLTCLYHLS